MPASSSPVLTGVRDVMVALTEEGRGDEVASSLGYGLTLARDAGAHLTVESASIRFVTTGLVLGNFVDELVGAENRRMASLARSTAERIAQDAARAGVVCTTESPSLQYDRLVARLSALARLHDLTILDAEPLAVLPDRDVIEGLLFESGRPLIVVPPGGDTFQARRIIVAWDGSAQAARAANDALPFLRAAEAVALVCVDEPERLQDRVPGVEFAPHLARHGVTVTVEDRPADGDAAEALRRAAAGFRADLIVMGAFRHSRLREWILGGVTQSLLARCDLPLFMAH
ncbi:universal stress protein UspA [Methylobacterium sp. Leaf456]|uniref:universal stress protein n=1 Tax=Methylobacterium sp. Leaf456 TaxID=1736382 RepID=UPI0006F5A587|nr:universal stress protein [Methylobacterium sp. Leaf456]KQT59913.1 universal stress protein UspA [Methylobacterium sp. Leaf456]